MNPVISILEVSKLQLFKFRDSNMYIGLRKPQQNDLRLIASGEILKLFSLLTFVHTIFEYFSAFFAFNSKYHNKIISYNYDFLDNSFQWIKNSTATISIDLQDKLIWYLHSLQHFAQALHEIQIDQEATAFVLLRH
jgi:hypothetical protein